MRAKILIIALFAMASISSHAQSISYDYDDAGNRTARHFIPLQVPQASAETETENGIEVEPEVYEDLLAEKQIKIYPNPTRGKLAIEIVNYNLNDVGTIQVFDMAGRLVQNVTKLSNQLEVDITNEPPGSYIIIIVIGDEKSEWKVVKQ